MRDPLDANDEQRHNLAYDAEVSESTQRAAGGHLTEAILDYESKALASTASGAYAAWKHPDFAWFSAGYATALIGGQIQMAAIAWEVYTIHRREMDLGWLGLVQAIPIMLLALPAGHVADRFHRKNVVIIGQTISLLCSIWLAFLSVSINRGNLHFTWFYLPLFISSAAFTFNRAARHAMLPSLVPKPIFANAVTWNSSIFELSQAIGPCFGALVMFIQLGKGAGLWMAYVLAAIGQAAYLFFLTRIKVDSRPAKRPINNVLANDKSEGIASGLRFVFRHPIILGTISLDLFAVLLGGATYILPALADKVLHVGPVEFNLLRAAPSVGAILMAIIQVHLPPFRHAGRILLLAVAAFGLATIGVGLSRSLGLTLLMLFLTGAFDNVSVVVRHTLVQLLTPDQMRGRVSAVNNVFIGASNELGGWESGLTAEWFGIIPSITCGGIGTMVVVATIAVNCPAIRRFGSLHDAKPLPTT